MRLGQLLTHRSMSVLSLLQASWLSTNQPLARQSYPKDKGDATDLAPHTATRRVLPRITSPALSFFALFVILSVWPSVTLAEVRAVTAQGEHRMGDRGTREDAVRLARMIHEHFCCNR